MVENCIYLKSFCVIFIIIIVLLHYIVNQSIIIVGFLQPALLQKRFEKGDADGFLDRHWVAITQRKKVYFEEIGPKATDGLDLTTLFREVFSRHHDGAKVSFAILSPSHTPLVVVSNRHPAESYLFNGP